MQRHPLRCQSSTLALLSWQRWPWLCVGAAHSEVATILIPVTSTPKCSPDVWAIVFLCCTVHSNTVQKCTHPLVTFDRLCGITLCQFVAPQRITFPSQFIKKASLAVCNVYSAGCSVCCRAEACSQLEVWWDSGDRVIKYFSTWLLLIHSSGRAYRFICILQTVVVTIKKIWQHFMEQSKWSTEAWKLITSSLLPVGFLTECELHAEWNSNSASGLSKCVKMG